VRLGITLARRGFLPVSSIVICVATTIGMAVLGAVLAARGPESPAHDAPLLASGALAWGGGFLLAFSAAAKALRRDREEGILALFVARTTSLRGYLAARIGGLAALIALLVAGGTLVCGLVTSAASSSAAAVPRVLHATGAGVVFALAFSAVVAPLAFAALGARSRIGGYLFLVGVVMVPEAIVLALGSALPASLAEVLSIPSALSALRSALAPGSVDLARALRALVALAVVVGLAVAVVRREAVVVDRPEVDA
jgi:hypothetical protein